jgi:hypothetical protein
MRLCLFEWPFPLFAMRLYLFGKAHSKLDLEHFLFEPSFSKPAKPFFKLVMEHYRFEMEHYRFVKSCFRFAKAYCWQGREHFRLGKDQSIRRFYRFTQIFSICENRRHLRIKNATVCHLLSKRFTVCLILLQIFPRISQMDADFFNFICGNRRHLRIKIVGMGDAFLFSRNFHGITGHHEKASLVNH